MISSDLRAEAHGKLRQTCLCRFFSLAESPGQVQNPLVNAGCPGWRPLLGQSEEARNRRAKMGDRQSRVRRWSSLPASGSDLAKAWARSRNIREEIL